VQDLERDHGVAGETHWLLDEELVPRRPPQVTRPLPALLRHDTPLETPGEGITEDAPPPTDTFSFALGLLAALAIYFILRAADVGGALQRSQAGESSAGSVVVTATLTAEPEGHLEGAEAAALRSLLGSAASSGPNRGEDSPAGPSTPVAEQAPPPPPPPTEEPVVPPQPPAPLPAPDPLALLHEVPQPRKAIEELERATGLEPATLSLEG
jgi:outer membrane biosynthesis protein TonB